MKINKAQLIELLAEKTGMEKQEVEQQLKELIKRIKDAASRGKALEIKNFGLFYFDSDKNLRFDPADSFRTEVNFKYAGMEPVEVKPPRETTSEQDKSSEEDIPKDKKAAETEEKDIFGFDDDTAEKKEKKEIEATDSDEKISPVFKYDDELDPEKPDESAKADKSEKTGEPAESGKPEDPDDDDPFKDLLSGISLEPSEQKRDEKEIKKAGTRPKVSVSTQAGKLKKSKKEPEKKSKPPQKKKKDPIMLVMAVVLAFVVIVAGFFIVSDMTDTPPQEPDPPAVTEQREAVEAEPEPEPADAVEPDTEPGQPVAEDMETEPEPVLDTVYGLTGTIVDEANDGFTIVLHSLRNNNNAQAAAENLRDQGYRTLITERTIDGDTVYRVAVGQFPTVREAQDKAAELPEPYRNQNFIQRIQ